MPSAEALRTFYGGINVWFAHRLLGTIDVGEERPSLQGAGWNFINNTEDEEPTKKVA